MPCIALCMVFYSTKPMEAKKVEALLPIRKWQTKIFRLSLSKFGSFWGRARENLLRACATNAYIYFLCHLKETWNYVNYVTDSFAVIGSIMVWSLSDGWQAPRIGKLYFGFWLLFQLIWAQFFVFTDKNDFDLSLWKEYTVSSRSMVLSTLGNVNIFLGLQLWKELFHKNEINALSPSVHKIWIGEGGHGRIDPESPNYQSFDSSFSLSNPKTEDGKVGGASCDLLEEEILTIGHPLEKENVNE